ncbi:MAG TPA: DUF2878 domain-containing protein [Burkholderiaceae bacterium]|nr:DUF2878 domain-containing protein [Burkholderiaceae bacterium]
MDAHAHAAAAAEPTTRRKIQNFLVFQLAWAAAVIGAARGLPWLGTATVVAAVAWHLMTVAAPPAEARLVGIVTLIGLAFETLRVQLGDVAYPSGQPIAMLPPHWLVALWSLLAITLNLSLRWLKRHLAMAALLGALGGPLSFVAGTRLGGARFVDAQSALVTLAVGWCILTPALALLARRFDGVVPREASHG